MMWEVLGNLLWVMGWVGLALGLVAWLGVWLGIGATVAIAFLAGRLAEVV